MRLRQLLFHQCLPLFNRHLHLVCSLIGKQRHKEEKATENYFINKAENEIFGEALTEYRFAGCKFIAVYRDFDRHEWKIPLHIYIPIVFHAMAASEWRAGRSEQIFS